MAGAAAARAAFLLLAAPLRLGAAEGLLGFLEAELGRGRKAELVQSSGDIGDRLESKGHFDFVSDYDFKGPTVRILRDAVDQEIVGFGGAFTEAAALVYKGLPESHQRVAIESYFGKDGIGLTLGRVPINSCDFSPHSYSFDGVDEDYDLWYFDTGVAHDTEAMIPFIKAAQDALYASGRELKLLATPWSPPAWMKTNGKMLGRSWTWWNGWESGWLKDASRGAWAKYFSKWISAYKAHGVKIWAITPQNEPENPAVWEGCVFSVDKEMEFLGEHLGPTLRADHPEVQILVYDHNKDHIEDWAKAWRAHPKAAQFASGVAFHWYMGDQFENVAKVHKQFPEAMLLASEASFERWRWRPGSNLVLGDWAFGLGYAHDILGDLNAGASGWIDWNLMLDNRGGPNHVDNVCDAAMVVNGSDLFIHPQFYALGHFSKFVLPGSRRLETTVENSRRFDGWERPYGTCGHEDGLEAASFLRPDGHVAVVVLNCGDEAVKFKLQDGSEALALEIPGGAIQTYLIDKRPSSIFM